MEILGKLLSAFRGAAAQAGLAVVDSQAFRIADQERRDAESALSRARRDLTLVMAEEIKARRRLEAARQAIVEREGQARAALALGDEALARQLAERLTELAEEEIQWLELATALADRVARLRQALTEADTRLADFRRRYSVSKATASAQRAQGLTLSSSGYGRSALSEAEQTLERIALQQEDCDARLAAMSILSDGHPDRSLDGRLRLAGLAAPLRPDPEAILLRLRGELTGDHHA